MSFINNLIDLTDKVDFHSGIDFTYCSGGSFAIGDVDDTVYDILHELATEDTFISVIMNDHQEIINADFDNVIAIQDIQGGRFVKVDASLFSAYKALYTKQHQNRLRGINGVTDDILTVLINCGYKNNKELKRNVEILEKFLINKRQNFSHILNIYKNLSGVGRIKKQPKD